MIKGVLARLDSPSTAANIGERLALDGETRQVELRCWCTDAFKMAHNILAHYFDACVVRVIVVIALLIYTIHTYIILLTDSIFVVMLRRPLPDTAY